LAGAATFVTAILAAACGENLVTQPAADDAPAYRLGPSPIGHFERNLPPGQFNATVRFTIDPKTDAYVQIGPHYIYIPAGSVCADGSGYGAAYWEVPCTATTKSVNVTATAWVKDRHPFVDFDKDIRFRPNKDAKPVMLYMRDDNANARSVITYCATGSTKCVDESGVMKGLNLNTRFDPKGLYVYRRVQHFSGYNVTGGRDCESESDCGGGL
jgi:hypothetical protein